MSVPSSSTDNAIQRLKIFKSKLVQHRKTNDSVSREWLNQNLGWVRRQVADAGCHRTMIITPPPIIGGVILRNADPLNYMFEDPHGRSLVPTICDMIDSTIGVLLDTPVAALGRPIYNLLVSGSDAAWTGEPFEIEFSRCLREYTDPALSSRYGSLDDESVAELGRAPCIFAYELGHKLPPKFGYIKEVVNRLGKVRVDYQIHNIKPFLAAVDLENMAFELDIGKLELYRSHWAVKDVNLPRELHAKGITLPAFVRDVANPVDISKYTFDVALSFPGESRPFVERVAQELERRLGPNAYFYDNNYVSQLAQPSLDTLLQSLYKRARLDVVFLSGDYQRKDWCGIEFRAVREIMFSRENMRVMFVKMDDGEVEGVSKTDGYVDARRFDPARIAEFICERVGLLRSSGEP